jgi:hypothetical protein
MLGKVWQGATIFGVEFKNVEHILSGYVVETIVE